MSPIHFVPPGQNPPFSIITSTDQGGKAIIATAIGLSFVLFCLLIRTYVRIVINGPWGRDDTIVVIATVSDPDLMYGASQLKLTPGFLCCPICACLLPSLQWSRQVFGPRELSEPFRASEGEHKILSRIERNIDREPLITLQASYVSNIFFILILYLSKFSVVLLILRLTRDARHHRTCKKLLAGITAWAVAAILMITLQCDLTSTWITIGTQCSDLVSAILYD